MASAVTLHREPFGVTSGGTPVERFTVRSPQLELRLLSYGAVVQELHCPDRRARWENVALGLGTLAEYEAYNNPGPYLGAIVGRYGNRIAGASFVLDGERHTLDANDGANTLHGGSDGFDRRVWEAAPIEEPDGAGVRFTLESPDGDQGFPGTLHAQVEYLVTGDGYVRIRTAASTDKPTVASLVNHTYFNLAGESSGSVLDHLLTVHGERFCVPGPGLLPTGEVAPVAGTPLDFRLAHAVGSRIGARDPMLWEAKGYDFCWALDGGRPAAVLSDPASGRVLELTTTYPGLQVYTGGNLDGTVTGIGGRAYRPGDGIALEAEHFPDSPNHPHFPSAVVRPGETVRHETTWRLHAR